MSSKQALHPVIIAFLLVDMRDKKETLLKKGVVGSSSAGNVPKIERDHLQRNAAMNINTLQVATKSMEQLGDLLINMTTQAMDLQHRLLKATVTEKVSQAGLGENVDVSA